MNQLPDTQAPRRRQREDGRRSRDAILDSAARLATVDGLEGLSIGNLAERTGMSKSGLYAHFKSKQELQIATIERAGEIFDREVVDPARRRGDGLRLLWALADEFIAHLQRHVFPGGCFFAAVGAEFDTHPGPVRDLVAAFSAGWVQELESAAAQAARAGEIEADDVEQLVFEVNSLLLMAHAGYTMFDDETYLDRARSGLVRRLGPQPI